MSSMKTAFSLPNWFDGDPTACTKVTILYVLEEAQSDL